MSATEVAGLIAQLRAGTLSIDDVARRFRHRAWTETRRRPPATWAEMEAQQDADADVPGSFDEVTAAYDRGELASGEYRLLSEAVADGINASISRDT